MLNHNVGVWINLNRENKFDYKLREQCTSLDTWSASDLEEREGNNTDTYLIAADKNKKIYGF